MIIFVSIPSKGLFIYDNDNDLWKMNDDAKWRLADMHRLYPEDVFVIPSIQNYALLPFIEGVGPTYESWKNRCHQLINYSDLVIVLKAPNWEESVGVTDEIAYANEVGIPVTYAKW